MQRFIISWPNIIWQWIPDIKLWAASRKQYSKVFHKWSLAWKVDK